MLHVRAAAKVNLSLEIIGKRPDGYHELVSVMQEVTLSDDLEMELGDATTFSTDEESLAGDDNLVIAAVYRMAERFGPGLGCRIALRKHIPVGAGLGGGSSDAAAAISALKTLWQTNGDCDDYVQIASEIGSDVPFFLYGGVALVEGRGERVTPLPDRAEQWYVLVNPRIHVSTARVFGELRPDSWSSGSATRQLVSRLSRGEQPRFGPNGLQETLFRLYPEARECFQEVEALVPGRTIVTGSGPTVVVLARSDVEAASVAEALGGRGYWTASVRNKAREGRLPCP